ncbi:MAG: shikimate dehydrogenase [Myxococcota bacterium]|nr:shikimate dehydrogenase [Myxococcota bacterium]
MAIGTETVVCGIVLHPAGHTRSPAMHNAAFAACGIDAAYHAFDVPPERLGDAIRGMRALGIRQLAVSIPHKEAVIAHLDRVEETARAIGAVNTVTLGPDGELVGANTDWIGGLRAIEREIKPQGRRAVVLGAGGTARALVYALGQAGAEVWVLNRTQSRAAELAQQLGAAGSGGLDELSKREPEIIVNTTSVGLRSDESPVDPLGITSGAVVMDAVYVPEQTRLLADAANRGAIPIAGKWMLIHQAAEQFRLWTGREAPANIMADAFDQEASQSSA